MKRQNLKTVHEFSIVQELIETVEKQAKGAGADRVTQVKLRFNPLTGYVADHIRFSFDMAKKPSPLLADAVLVLEEIPGRVRCADCGQECAVEELPNLCPHCGSLQLQPLESRQLVLESYEIER